MVIIILVLVVGIPLVGILVWQGQTRGAQEDDSESRSATSTGYEPPEVPASPSLRSRITSVQKYSGLPCSDIISSAGIPSALCDGLDTAFRTGRTDEAGRTAINQYLQDHDYVLLQGYMVAQPDSGIYEIQRSGYRARSLLRTKWTTFTSQGYFSIWARKAGPIPIKTKNGFEEIWDVFVEDDMGRTVMQIINAPAGDETSEAARRAALALLE